MKCKKVKNTDRQTDRQDRTGQDRTGQDRTGQDRTRQDRTGQDKLDVNIYSLGRSAKMTVVDVIKDTYNCFTICNDYPLLRCRNDPLI